MRLFVTGSKGLLGGYVVAEAGARGHAVLPSSRGTLDVTDSDRCMEMVKDAAPDVVIHCAAYTDVDGAESNEDLAMAVNGDGARNLALAAGASGCLLVHISTDYVFDGRSKRPYKESDPPAPVGAYGRSKLAGEEAVREVGGDHLLVRTSWLYGRGGRNFVDSIRKFARERPELRIVADEFGRPTWGRTLANTLLDLISAGATGTVHGCDSGTASWFDLATAIVSIEGLSTSLVPIPATEWESDAPRPLYSVLDLGRAQSLLNRPLPHWSESLQSYLGETP
ncbi:MAG: dTDP-4-dehydrorhamnose reductase [Gemmatimonadetes bacterium]|nr:dTDP-4-dehydrorhamnose reductase [Gemmatimonadota bacterium]NNM06695.1 dTDP-4-dehydrorhamnose reductase [Gemmatimonadota bacterium]